MKNVPVKSVPAALMWQTELANKPVGWELIEQDVSPLLNCAGGFKMLTCTVVPGVAGGPVENVRVGDASTLKSVNDPKSPLLPVTVIV